jgi:quinol monooxygenase YgiN
MPLVSVTRLHLRSAWFLPAFFWHSNKAARQARLAPGNLLAAVRRDRHAGYWTLTVWADEAAMRAFMLAGAHRAAMPRLLDWCNEAAVVHWHQDSRETPTWDEAHRRLQSEGRTSKLKHPSEAHLKFQLPPH